MAFQYVIVKNSGRGRGYLPTIMPEASQSMRFIAAVREKYFGDKESVLEKNFDRTCCSPFYDFGLGDDLCFYEGIAGGFRTHRYSFPSFPYQKRRKTPPFRAGDIRRVGRICVSN